MRFSAALACCGLLGACAVGTDYKAPVPKTASAWHERGGAEVSPVAATPVAWWLQFHDETLTLLLQLTEDNNHDLAAANARILVAQAEEKGARAILFPQVQGVARVTRDHSGNGFSSRNDTIGQLGAQTDWDLDLAGGNKRRREAARANTGLNEADRDRLRLDLRAEVAINYIRLRGAQKQYALTLRNQTMQRDTLTITEGQRAEGAISDLDVVRAGAQLDATTARLPTIRTALVAALNRLSVLTGEDYDRLDQLLGASANIPSVPAQVAVTAPLTTLADLPEVHAAERRLAQAAALSNAAFAELFPKLSLEGFLGLQRSDLYGSLSPWSATINGLVPLLNFGRIRAGIDEADARQKEAYENYQQSVRLAVEGTENALTAYLGERRRAASLASAAIGQARAADIAREQYKSGVAGQLDLLVAERSQLDAENDLTQSQAEVAEDLVRLYRAMGAP